MASWLSALLMMCSASWATVTNNKVIGQLVPSCWGPAVLSPTFLSEKQQLQFLERLDWVLFRDTTTKGTEQMLFLKAKVTLEHCDLTAKGSAKIYP